MAVDGDEEGWNAWASIWHFMKHEKPEPDTIITFNFKKVRYEGRVTENGHRVEIGITHPTSWNKFYPYLPKPDAVMPLYKIRWWAYSDAISRLCRAAEKYSDNYWIIEEHRDRMIKEWEEREQAEKEQQKQHEN